MFPNASVTSKTYPKYIGWYYMMICGRLKKTQNLIIFRTFTPFSPNSANVRKMIEFCVFFNLRQIIMQYHPMYLEYVLDVKEAFGNICNHFSRFLSEWSIFWWQVKKSKKVQKIAFFGKNRFFKNCFKLSKIMIYGIKWVPLMS